MRIAVAQTSPVFLKREPTLAKAADWIARAAADRCELVCFGEAFVPAYPSWVSRMDGARFDAEDQKELFALYARESVCIEDGHLAGVCQAASKHGVGVVIGFIERPLERGGHSLFCSRAVIAGRGPDAGRILSVHRKLMPTYEERLVWGIGDGAGLVSHRVGEFTLGALNCWENWMPLARAALYAQGVDLHVMLWPGSSRLTRDITRFVARESRSYVVSAGVLIRESDIPADTPRRARMTDPGETLYDGGSCVAGPDGSWIVEPVSGREELITVDLEHAKVLAERQNFDPAGHYSRPDVLRLTVDVRRQGAIDRVRDSSTARFGSGPGDTP